MKRCSWVNRNNPKYVEYHDKEWGKPLYDDTQLFELLLLECFQAGLSWETVLNKREHFREAFDSFDCVAVSQYDDAKIASLMENKNIIRHKLKIDSAVKNAKVFIEIQEEYGSFAEYLWGFTQGKIIVNQDDKRKTSSPLSDTISKDLKKRGMKFVGTITIYAYLQAMGMVNDHELSCDFREQP